MMAAQLTKAGNAYTSAFREARQRYAGEPAWLRHLREDSFAGFERLGFPTVAQEEWKYTNVAPISQGHFVPVSQSNGDVVGNEAELAPFVYAEARHARLVFVNGILRSDLSSLEDLPSSVSAIDLIDATREGPNEPALQRIARPEKQSPENGFVELNTALFASGLFLKIPQGLAVPAPIHLLFVSSSLNREAPAASFPRVLIAAEENSAATIIESYVSLDDRAYFTNAVVDLQISAGARVEHYKVQRESTHAFHVAMTRADLGRNAFYGTTSINLGAALCRHNIDVLMDHEGAECAVDGLYMVDGSQHTDTHSVIDHRRPHCTSHQLYKGILDGKSRAVFNGKVFVRHGAQKTDARQTNKNLLLSKEARVDTKPQLEIFADDVKCTHGAAVGQLDEDETFYLESRGINPALARNLLTYGFAEEVIERIKIDGIRRELDAVVLNRLRTQI
jgi:Fe-S cluster assembly protein SufD